MIVGAALVDIHVHGSQSLKQKRGVVRSIVSRVRNRFNLSVAEVGGQETWQRATLAFSAVGSDERILRQALENAMAFVEDLHLAEVIGTEVEIIELPHEGSFLDSESDWESARESAQESSESADSRSDDPEDVDGETGFGERT